MFSLSAVFSFLVIFSLTAWIVLIKILKLGTIALKRLEYVCLVFASLGLISITADVKRMIDINELNMESSRAQTTYEIMLSFMMEGHPGSVCRSFQRTEFSPANFDEIVVEYDRACKWFAEVYAKMPKSQLPDIQSVRAAWIDPHFANEVVQDSIKTIKTYLDSYVEQAKTIEEKGASLRKSEIELTLFAFSPYLISISLALGFVKIAGEIQNEKRHNQAL